MALDDPGYGGPADAARQRVAGAPPPFDAPTDALTPPLPMRDPGASAGWPVGRLGGHSSPGAPVGFAGSAGAAGSAGPPGAATAVTAAGAALSDPLAAPIATAPIATAPLAPRFPGAARAATPSLAALLVPRATLPPPDAVVQQPSFGATDWPAPTPAADGGSPAAGAPPPPASGRRLALVALAVSVALALVAGSGGYAWHTRQEAQHNFRAARAWEAEAKAAQQLAEEQAAELDRLRAEAAELRAQIATLTAERDGANGRADGLQALLDDANRRLAASEQRIAELAGTQARAADQAILTR